MSRGITIDLPNSVQPTERIQVLDVLRGIALLGMIIVHFNYQGIKNSGLNQIVGKGIELFIESRFYALFAILFGAGFAIQFRRAKASGQRFVQRFLRRMLALACFGFVIEIAFGFTVLYSYAIGGLLLLPIRNWSTKALIITLFLCVMLKPIYRIAFSTTYVALYGLEQFTIINKQQNLADRTFGLAQNKRDSIAQNTISYVTALKVRTKHFLHNNPTSINKFIIFLSNTFMLILIGFIAMRLKLFEEPGKHRRLIIILMIFGIIFWALSNWALPFFTLTTKLKYPNVPFLMQATLYQLSQGFGLVQDYWLTFTYAGAVLLLVAYSPTKWLKRFKLFALAGRMALTNYMLQAMVLNLLFAKYALGFPNFPEALAPVFALLLFANLVLLSRWWLNRYQYGPLEWMWRSFTYWKKQRLRNQQKNITV